MSTQQQELTAARLAVNEWHACATQEELERWRQAQQRLIDAAKAVGRDEASLSAGAVPQARRWRCPDCGIPNLWDALECVRCRLISPPDKERWEFRPFVRSDRERLSTTTAIEAAGAVPQQEPQEQEPEFKFGLCSVCHGNGVLKIPRGVMTCARCDGSGREMRRK